MVHINAMCGKSERFLYFAPDGTPVVAETISLGQWQRRVTCCMNYLDLLTLNGDSGWGNTCTDFT